MNKLFSFLAGTLCGVLVGAVTALLMTPASGNQLRSGAKTRWETAITEARTAMEETRRELEAQFDELQSN